MNAVLVAVLLMLILALCRVPVIFSLIIAAIVGGLSGGMTMDKTIEAFNSGLGGGAEVALSYAVLGAFAVALSRTGIVDTFVGYITKSLNANSTEASPSTANKLIYFIVLFTLVGVAMASQNIVPVHIAFIPILVPPLLALMNMVQLDRRAVACALTFGLVATYMFLPIGFGNIFLHKILLGNMNAAVTDNRYTASMVMPAMLIPYLGMIAGLLIALFISYRKPRVYEQKSVQIQNASQKISLFKCAFIILSILATILVQLYYNSMVLAGLLGFGMLSLLGVFKWKAQDGVFIEGVRMMALVGFIMIAAQGFASVLNATGDVASLVKVSHDLMGNNQGIAAFVMLFVGLIITMGIGSSFSTVPIITTLYVPLCVQMGFSPMATIAIVGTAAALGDAGSPASDSTLGPTSGLNADGQHDHIWDTVVPTFIHYNIPLLVFGWIAAMVL